MSEHKVDYVIEAMEMMGIDLDAPKKIIQEVSGFTPMFDVVVNQYKDETRAAVHGIVWRFCQMEDGVCKASLDTIAEFIGVTKATVLRHIEILVEDGYFVDLTPDLRNRPHVYADTGKVIMKSKLTAGVAQKNVTVAQKNAGVAQSQLSKDLNKDFNKPLVDEVLAQISNAYEQEIGLITASIADELQDAAKSYSLQWILDAIHEAAIQNKRSWKYILAILKRWQAQGNQDSAKKKEPEQASRPEYKPFVQQVEEVAEYIANPFTKPESLRRA